MTALLEPIRVLDLSNKWGYFAGKVLAEMGADVVHVEPPGGDPMRKAPPLTEDGESTLWLSYNTSKRSVTLDIEDEDGREKFRALAAQADMVLECFTPGYLETIGLAPETLMVANPKLIVVSLTPFGQTGPRASYPASDTTIMALSGLMAVTGFPDLPPLRLGYDQILGLASTQAALGALTALYARGQTGRGQHVDVSALDAARLANYREPLRWEYQETVVGRTGNLAHRGSGGFTNTIWECRDGYITWSPGDDPRRSHSLFGRANEDGFALDYRDYDFAGTRIVDLPQDEIDSIESAIAPFFLKYTRAELEDMAMEKGWILISFLDIAEAAAQPQLAARGYWGDVNHSNGGTLRMPRYIFQSTAPRPDVKSPPPYPGEHNAEIFSELPESASGKGPATP